MPGGSRRKSMQEIYAPTKRVYPREECGWGLYWCGVVQFFCYLLYRSVANIVPFKRYISKICYKTSWIIYNLVLTLRLCCQDYTPPLQKGKFGMFIF